EHVEPLAVGHPQVCDHHIERGAGEGLRGGDDSVGLLDHMAATLEQETKRQTRGCFVVDEENGRHIRCLVTCRAKRDADRRSDRACYFSIPYSLSFRQSVVRPIPSASAARE